MNYFPKKIIIISYILCFFIPLSASENQDENQYKLQRYEEIKREQKREYKKGVYNDTKKDYVNHWIGNDINYQKKAIKLKKEYREWATDKISKKQEVRFKDYEPLKKMTRVEKQILYEYHTILFKNNIKQKSAPKKNPIQKKRIPEKKPVEDQNDKEIKINIEIPPVTEDVSFNKNPDNKLYYIILLSIAGILIFFASSIILTKKLRKSQSIDSQL